MVSKLDEVIKRKAAVAKSKAEIKRRKGIGKTQTGKKKKRKAKNKGKKRKVKTVTTTQTKQKPIILEDKKTNTKLEVNIVAKERRKKGKGNKITTFAEKKNEAIVSTGVADPSQLRQQQKIASDILGYSTQTRDPLGLTKNRRGRYNVGGGVGGFSNVPGNPTLLRSGLQSVATGSAYDRRLTEIDRFLQNEEEMKRRRIAAERRRPNLRRGDGAGRRGSGGSSDSDDDYGGGGVGGGGRPLRRGRTARTPTPKATSESDYLERIQTDTDPSDLEDSLNLPLEERGQPRLNFRTGSENVPKPRKAEARPRFKPGLPQRSSPPDLGVDIPETIPLLQNSSGRLSRYSTREFGSDGGSESTDIDSILSELSEGAVDNPVLLK